MHYPWHVLATWAPFTIDALGLVTLLGAEEVNASVGRLAPSRWLEYMPQLAGFIFASDRHRTKQAAFTLYNISSGIVTGNLAAWFTRWMQAQEFEAARSVVYWQVEKVPQNRWKRFLVSGIVSWIFTGFLVVMTVLSGDWLGFANAVSIVGLIVTRAWLVQTSRDAIDEAVSRAEPMPTTFSGAIREWEKRVMVDPDAVRPREDERVWRPEHAKIVITMPNSQAVTMFIPEHLLRPIFVTDVTPSSPVKYRLAQWAAWVAFTVHIITLGMAKLSSQIYIITLMITSTVLTCYGFGCDDSRLFKWWQIWMQGDSRSSQPQPYLYRAGLNLTATVFEWPQNMEFAKDAQGKMYRRYLSEPIPRAERSKARMDLYAWLNLSKEEQRSLSDWHLFPHRRSHDDTWWKDFEAKQVLIRDDPCDIHMVARKIRPHLDRLNSTAKIFSPMLLITDEVEKGLEEVLGKK